jgi:hypothetical protein
MVTEEQAKTIQVLMEQLEILAKVNQSIGLQTEPELFYKNVLVMIEIAKIVYQSQF